MKVLYKPAKYAEHEERKIKISDSHWITIENPTKDFSTQYGVVSKDLLKKKKATCSFKGETFYIFDANPLDIFPRFKRTMQLITPKDAAAIIARTGITKKSVVIDAGSGSGGLACFLALHVKTVYSYDINEEAIAAARENAKLLGLKNVQFSLHDITKTIPKKNADLVVLDMLHAEQAISSVCAALKTGGYLVAYTPSITQALQFVNTALTHANLAFLSTMEIIERSWKVDGKILRPNTEGFGHSAFLTFIRKIN
ncbi:MAG: methyltransferase domain-containing protein [archaeon]